MPVAWCVVARHGSCWSSVLPISRSRSFNPAPVGTANPCASLSEVSGAASGADVENLISACEDGSRVYFMARGVLAGNLGANDLPASAGANNLYVWEKDAAHPAGKTTFIAGLELFVTLPAL